MSHNGLLISIELDKELLVDEKQLFVRLRLLKKYDLCSLANESSSFSSIFLISFDFETTLPLVNGVRLF